MIPTSDHAPLPSGEPCPCYVCWSSRRITELEAALADERKAHEEISPVVEELIGVAKQKLVYVLSAYGPTFRDKAKELKELIAKAKRLI